MEGMYCHESLFPALKSEAIKRAPQHVDSLNMTPEVSCGKATGGIAKLQVLWKSEGGDKINN
eukprot:CAMPEP_0172483566 /NCGR_PEP_ID=MMETSP1066-20121228/10551_1 /TAXON_ID=671091 /ORGANISM="Coscinodiscus wailesii, Strain CCMP2513" /LENGTH=61 /DNA_ID=CAMNT_0013247483 /DNA_START=442 /DNA_END=627 /DNA_ORIENTATION=-